MATAEELLAEMEDNPEAYADTGTEYCTVDDITRVVTVPECYKILGVESDERAKRIWFRFPKIVGDSKDLSAFDIHINYYNASSEADIHPVQDVTEDGEYIIFSWELKRKVTKYKGNVGFIVCATFSDSEGNIENEWNTTLNKDCKVLEGFEASAQIEEENPEIIEYILARLDGAATISPEDIASAVQEYMQAHPIEIPDSLPNPCKLTFAGAVTTEYDGSGAVTVTIPDGTTERIGKTAADTVAELQPNRLYVFPEMAKLSLTFAEPEDTTIVNEYHCIFASGETATVLTLPDSIKIPDEMGIKANKIYELSILENCLAAQSWDAAEATA